MGVLVNSNGKKKEKRLLSETKVLKMVDYPGNSNKNCRDFFSSI